MKNAEINADGLMKTCELARNAHPVREIELRVQIDSKKQSVEYRLLAGYTLLTERVHFAIDPTPEYVNEKLGVKAPTIHIIEKMGINTPRSRFEDYCRYGNYRQIQRRLPRAERRACSQINSPCRLNPSSRFIMYVGSYTTNTTQTRIDQQMGYGHQGTYALHLRYWFTGECRIIIRQYDVSMETGVLRIITDSVADELKPVFGQRANN